MRVEELKKSLNDLTPLCLISGEDAFFRELAIKTIKKKTSKIMEAVQELKGDDNPDIDDGDIAAVLMAADELKLLKIFPPTPENIYKAFVKTTDAYINDETISKMAVDYYLKKIGEQG